MAEFAFVKQDIMSKFSRARAGLLAEEVRDLVPQILQHLGIFLEIELPIIPTL